MGNHCYAAKLLLRQVDALSRYTNFTLGHVSPDCTEPFFGLANLGISIFSCRLTESAIKEKKSAREASFYQLPDPDLRPTCGTVGSGSLSVRVRLNMDSEPLLSGQFEFSGRTNWLIILLVHKHPTKGRGV